MAPAVAKTHPTTSAKKRVSKEVRAGIDLSVSRVARILRSNLKGRDRRVSDAASVKSAAMVEFLLERIIVAARGHAAIEGHKSLTRTHIMNALNVDQQLLEAFGAQKMLVRGAGRNRPIPNEWKIKPRRKRVVGSARPGTKDACAKTVPESSSSSSASDADSSESEEEEDVKAI